MIELKESDLREIRRIQESIPEDLKRRIVIKRAVTPAMAQAVRLGLHSKDVPPEVKEKLQHIKDSGIVDQKEEVENKTVAKKIRRYVDSEIEKSIRAGRLSARPNREQITNITKEDE